MTEPMRIAAPAKLNLSLRVVGRRADGFHELDSTFVLLELADRLLLMPGCAGFRVDGERVDGVPVGDENLAWRGLVAGLGIEPDLACLTLEKRIPVGAGLGGGSSDAAAAWRLGRAWRGIADAPTADELRELAAIGADVPFFAAAVPAARVSGIGERVEEIPSVRRPVVLVHPPYGLSTAAVFGNLRSSEWGTAENDLLAPALRLRPELGAIMADVRAAAGEARLTGSGSTVFALDTDAERAARAAIDLRGRGHRVTLTTTRRTAPAVEPVGDGEADDRDEADPTLRSGGQQEER